MTSVIALVNDLKLEDFDLDELVLVPVVDSTAVVFVEPFETVDSKDMLDKDASSMAAVAREILLENLLEKHVDDASHLLPMSFPSAASPPLKQRIQQAGSSIHLG